jgi:hypothetical protein
MANIQINVGKLCHSQPTEEYPPRTQRAIFLTVAGPHAVKLYESMNFHDEDQDDLAIIFKKFDDKTAIQMKPLSDIFSTIDSRN